VSNRFRVPSALLMVVLLLTVALLIVGGGCRPGGTPGDETPGPGDGDGEQPPQPGDGDSSAACDDLTGMLPRIPGAVWEFAGEGNEFAGFRQELKYARDDLVQLEVDNGGAVAGGVYRLEPQRLVRLIHRVDGYEGQSLLGEPPDEERVLLRAPLRAGEAWEQGRERREITAVEVELDLPAGTIAGAVQVRVTYEDSSSVVDEYYVSGLGLVARRFSDPPSGAVVTSELASFSFGEPIHPVGGQQSVDEGQQQSSDGQQPADEGQQQSSDGQQPADDGQQPTDDGGAVARPADWIMYAYQAERSVRGTLRAAYYAWLSCGVADTSHEEAVAGILAHLRQQLALLATPEVINGRIPWLEEIDLGGEGEVLFPDRERLTAGEVLEADGEHARVRLTLYQHFPEWEISGPAFAQEREVVVGLVPGESGWLINDLTYGEPVRQE